MIHYLLRRILLAIPILIGVNLITFSLFFLVNTPNDMARMHLGEKHITQTAIQNWKAIHGYDKPNFFNPKEPGIKKITETLFAKKSMSLFLGDFGQSTQGRSIAHDIETRMMPSLAFAIPVLFLGLVANISLALLFCLLQGTRFDAWGLLFCVALMSVSSLFYIIVGQFLFSHLLKLAPVSGYQPGWDAWRFLLLPVVIAVISNLGAGTRWYRTLFLEEQHKEYVKTARAKGLSESAVLFKHILRSALVPIITGVVAVIPLLFMGSLIMESFFGIPGLGSYTIDAIAQQDFDIVRVMVFLGTFFYIIGLMLTDIAYTVVDPRIRLA
jgi:peptide/nickel transport system permease protein